MNTSDIIAVSDMIVSGVSACASIVTLYFAKTALNTWKSQEILKSKKDFKMALLEMKFVVLWLPESIDVDHLMVGRRLLYNADDDIKAPMQNKQVKAFKGYALEFEKFEDAMQKCARMWFASESLFKGNQVEQLWQEIYEAYNEYSQGRQNQSFFVKRLDKLLLVDMYFEASA